jgi:DNA mismatch endonuclease (patch repair protein)
MSRIKGRDTKPELLFRKALHARGYRYRLHDKRLPGTPDLVLTAQRCAIFIHGCYWHGHENCRYFRLPKSNTAFWQEKIGGNIARDQRNIAQLLEAGWRVLVVWECAIRSEALRQVTAEDAQRWIDGGEDAFQELAA